MLGQVLRGPGGVRLAATARQRQRHFGRAVQRPRLGRRRVGKREDSLRRRRAIVVVDLIAQLQSTVDGAFRLADEADLRRRVGRHRKGPAAQFPVAGGQSKRAARIELRAELARFGRCRRDRIGRCIHRRGSRLDGANRTVLMGDAQRLVARTAGDAQRNLAACRHGDRRRVGIGIGGQEDRRLAGIGRRRHPGVDAGCHACICRLRAKTVADPAALRSKRKGEGCDQQQCRCRAQAPRVMLRHTRARQVGTDIVEPRRHALLMLAPQRPGKAGLRAARAVVLYLHGAVQQGVGRFDAPIDFSRRRQAEDAERIERANGPNDKYRHDGKPCRIRQHPEQAEPGQAGKQRNDDEQRQQQRPAPLDDHRRTRGPPAERQPCRIAAGARRGSFCHRPFIIGPRVALQGRPEWLGLTTGRIAANTAKARRSRQNVADQDRKRPRGRGAENKKPTSACF